MCDNMAYTWPIIVINLRAKVAVNHQAPPIKLIKLIKLITLSMLVTRFETMGIWGIERSLVK